MNNVWDKNDDGDDNSFVYKIQISSRWKKLVKGESTFALIDGSQLTNFTIEQKKKK